MKAKPRLYALIVLVPLSAIACQQGGREDGGGQESGALEEAGGDPFSAMAMVHASPEGGPGEEAGGGAPGPPVPTVKWDGRKQGGPFSYSSVRCIDPAPVNDISTNLTTFSGRLPQSSSPASIRIQPIQFQVPQGGDSGRLEGTMNVVACGLSPGFLSRVAERTEGPDDARDKITFTWRADYRRSPAVAAPANAGELSWIGVFNITGGTGRYEGIKGSGRISGNFFCLQGGGCNTPEYTDGQIVLTGTYTAPNIPAAPAG